MRRCFVSLASPIHDKVLVNNVIGRILSKINSGVELELVNKGLITDKQKISLLLAECDIIIGLVVTGGSEELIIETSALRKPTIFIAHPTMNSLPALLEAKPLAEELNSKVWSIYLDVEKNPETISRLAKTIRGIEVALSLYNYNLGLIGGISPWLVYSRIDPITAKKKLGINIVEVPLEEIYKTYNITSEEQVINLMEKVKGNAEKIEVNNKRIIDALKLYMALRNVIKEKNLNAITIKCFDIIFSLDTTACLPLSMLNSEGIVAGCEGDVPSAIAMIVLNKLSNKPVFMGNPSKIEGNKLMIAHCTAPMSIGSYILRTHFETGRGVGIAVNYPEKSPVTLLRFSPSLDRMRVLRGLIVKGEPESNMHCRTQVTIELNVEASILLEKSMGNHYALVIGDYAEELKSFAKTTGIYAEIL